MALAVLLTVAGDQVPVMPLVEVVGKTGAADPVQMGLMALKAGVFGVPTVMSIVVVAVAH